MNKCIMTAVCGLAFTTASAQTKTLPDRPNILLILVDDLGYGDLSCQHSTKDVHTPNIDKVLNEGIRFTNFYANCPVSSPSRAALMTGRYPDLVGVPGVVRPQFDSNYGYLSEDAILLPEMLKKKKYHTALIGKWHLGYEAPNVPTMRGFEYFKGFLGGMVDDYYKHERFGYGMYENLEPIKPQGHATDLLGNWAIEYIKDRKDLEDPFFLYLAFNAPHSPVQPPQEWYEKVRKREPHISDKRAKLVALIEHLDYNIGRVYKTLEDGNMLSNTIILFASDNGGQASSESCNLPFRGAKEDMYEGGIHVAGGIYWKGHILPQVNDNFVLLFDYFPTLCELAGVSVEQKIDAISILPLLKGEKQKTDERMVYWARREGGPKYGGQDYYAARYKDMKILQNTPYEPILFFNVKTDFSEKSPIENHSSSEYKELYNGLSKHISKAGAIPWQKNK